MQSHDGLLPARQLAHALAETALLAFTVHRPHPLDANVEQFLNRHLDLVLGGDRIDLEGVGVVTAALVRPLFGDERAEDHLVRPQVEPRLAVNARLTALELPHILLWVW